MENKKSKNKSFLIATLIALLLTFSLPTKTFAFWPFDLFTKKTETGTETKFPTIIERIIEKFKLNKDEVGKTITDFQEEKRKERQAQVEEKLNQAVKDGVLTESQKEALLKRQSEMEQKRTQSREEMQKWLEDSGIDFEKLAPYGVGFFGRGFKKGFGRGQGFGGKSF